MQENIADRVVELVGNETGVEILLVEVLGGGTLRVFIDHPDGVALEHCEAVTGRLEDLRDRFAIEVSSPGPERPLTKPEHFRRFSGRQARLKLTEPLSDDSRRTLSGEIVDAGDASVTLRTEDGTLDVAYESIGKANLVAA